VVSEVVSECGLDSPVDSGPPERNT